MIYYENDDVYQDLLNQDWSPLLRYCLEIGDQGNNDDRYDDYFEINMMIILVVSHDDYDDAGGDQGHSHDNDLL